ncbi:MAG TPA: putative collagen-binding domain-containing protein, partial [Opitutus sp.]|nr:putative collagen-binding domain-containing protein [Opitutus sp.]
SRDQSWDYARIALRFFREQQIPFWEMQPADELVGNSIGAESYYCLAKPGELYLVYLPWGDVSTIDLRETSGEYSVKWFNPRTGGPLVEGPLKVVHGGKRNRIGLPPTEENEDWVIVIRRNAGGNGN